MLYSADVYLESCQTSMMDLSCKNVYLVLAQGIPCTSSKLLNLLQKVWDRHFS